MRKTYPFMFGIPETRNLNLKEEKQEVAEGENKKKLPAQNNTVNVVKFEDCDFENTTIILNFEAPD